MHVRLIGNPELIVGVCACGCACVWDGCLSQCGLAMSWWPVQRDPLPSPNNSQEMLQQTLQPNVQNLCVEDRWTFRNEMEMNEWKRFMSLMKTLWHMYEQIVVGRKRLDYHFRTHFRNISLFIGLCCCSTLTLACSASFSTLQAVCFWFFFLFISHAEHPIWAPLYPPLLLLSQPRSTFFPFPPSPTQTT